jgi:O-antigen/teichoic acid export membrane protein
VQAFAYAYEKFVFSSLVSFFQKVLLALGGSAALILGYQVLAVTALSASGAWAASLAAGVILFIALQRGSWHPREETNPTKVPAKGGRHLLQDAFPLFITSMLAMLYFRIDTVFLGYMTTDVETGLYNSAYRFLEISNVLPSILIAVSQATMAKDALNNRLQVSFRRYAKVMLVFSIGALAALQIVSFMAPKILSDPGYARSAFLIRLLSLTVIPLYLNYLLLTALTILNRQKQIVLVSGLGVVFNVATNWVIIPRWQSAGAAVTTAASELFVMIFYGILLYRTPGFLIKETSQ